MCCLFSENTQNGVKSNWADTWFHLTAVPGDRRATWQAASRATRQRQNVAPTVPLRHMNKLGRSELN